MVIVSGSRTAIGTFGSGLKDVPVVELGGIVMKDVLKRANFKPVAGVVAMETVPDKLRDQGLPISKRNPMIGMLLQPSCDLTELIMVMFSRLPRGKIPRGRP